MRKSKILLVSVFALLFVFGTVTLSAHQYWAGTGTGTETLRDSHKHPFQSWTATLDDSGSPYTFNGHWTDIDGNEGWFSSNIWNYLAGGTWTGYSYNDGNFQFWVGGPDTLRGTGQWYTTLDSLSGSGTISGSQL